MFFELFSNFHNENHIPPLSKNVSEVVLGSSVQAKCRYIIPRGPSNFYSLVSRFSLSPRSILKCAFLLKILILFKNTGKSCDSKVVSRVSIPCWAEGLRWLWINHRQAPGVACRPWIIISWTRTTRIAKYPLGTLDDFIRDQVLGFVMEALDTLVLRSQWPRGIFFKRPLSVVGRAHHFYGGRSPP